MLNNGNGYQSYLLRVWPVQSKEQITWRASLESVQTGQVQGFASLAELWDFLQGLTGCDPMVEEEY